MRPQRTVQKHLGYSIVHLNDEWMNEAMEFIMDKI